MRARSFIAVITLLISMVSCASPGMVVSEEQDIVTDEEVIHDTLTICSFNIQFLGHFKDRDDSLLGELLNQYDVVVIQEMVAPPVNGVYVDGTPYEFDMESARFHSVMTGNGFDYWISEEDTGPSKNHTNSSASEWWVLYYKEAVKPDTLNEPYGFLSETLVGDTIYQRVPYSFALKSADGSTSINLISVHLNPGGSSTDKAVRDKEFLGIYNWISMNAQVNKDYIILGDCNIEDKDELVSVESTSLKEVYHSLNSECLSTNTKFYEAESKGKPYDHVFLNESSTEDVINESFKVVDLRSVLEEKGREDFFPYEHNYFRTRLSDHMPVVFKIITGNDTD